MNRLTVRRVGIRAGVVVCCLALGALAVPGSAVADAITQVFVTNDNAHPVPVRGVGSFVVGGSVKVSNLPAVQRVTGTVDVGNFPAPPAVQAVTGTVQDGNPVSTVPTIPGAPYSAGPFGGVTVPEGHRMVVESVSINVSVRPGHNLTALLQYTTSNRPSEMFLPISFAYAQAGFDHYVAALPVRIYADSGSVLTVRAYSPTGETGDPAITVSGYLV